jgi:hypothetical protein
VFAFDETMYSSPEIAMLGSGSDQPADQAPAAQLPQQQAVIVSPVAPTVPAATQPDAVDAGVGFLEVVLGGIGGFLLGRWWGVGAGVLGVGALRNSGRAYREWRTQGSTPEASKSATVAAIGMAAALWMGYNAKQKREEP